MHLYLLPVSSLSPHHKGNGLLLKGELKTTLVSKIPEGQREGHLWLKQRGSLVYQREPAVATETCVSPLWAVSKLKIRTTSSKPQLTAS